MHIKGQSRAQAMLFPERLDELITEDNPVRVIDAFIDALDLKTLGFVKAESLATISVNFFTVAVASVAGFFLRRVGPVLAASRPSHCSWQPDHRHTGQRQLSKRPRDRHDCAGQHRRDSLPAHGQLARVQNEPPGKPSCYTPVFALPSGQ